MSTQALHLISSMATRKLLDELAAQYTGATGQSVSCSAAGGVDVAKRVRAGEYTDVVVLADNVIDKLIAEGHLLMGSRVDVVRSGVAVAVPATDPVPDLSSEESVRLAVLAAPTISYSTGPSGVYLEQLFTRWGIFETVKPRIVVPPPGVPVGSLVADGRVALGFQQLSELLGIEGLVVAGPLPPAIQTITVFSGAVSAQSRTPAAAAALLAQLGAPATAAVKQRHGMDGA
ncbi:MAG: substrate-binding domain-containing protein [Proteobacteria bacterium]|jgi:molybdate transport system substrate-binding protein|nr:substrate-binding domain-containing protein [Pseudomonadota bacterium]